MSGTTCPQVLDYLIELMRDNAPDGTTVVDGHPGAVQDPLMLTLGGGQAPTVQWTQDAAELGRASTAREERYMVSLIASAAIGGGQENESTVRGEAWGIVQAIDEAIRLDPTLGGLCRHATVTQGQADGTNPETVAQGRLWTIEFFVEVTARTN